MPRRARVRHAGVPQHVIQRGNNRAACFFADENYQSYLDSLQEGATRYGCNIHAYVLMTNHVHLLVTPEADESLSCMMRYLGSRYVQYVNHVYRRSGTLWEGRYKSSLIDSEGYLLTCYRYIELNPVRAGMVENASDYRWSSYGAHALGQADELIRDHACYLALGATDEIRHAAYQALFRHQIDEASLKAIRESVNSGTALGSERFKDEIEATLARSVRLGTPGRPRKKGIDDVTRQREFNLVRK
ncbi:MAG TPA: transposase [Methylobacter sp.]